MASSAHSTDNHLTETKGDGLHPQFVDLENGQGGASLGRQISVNLTAEQFEKLYLQPGGQAAKGDLSKRLGNPTALGVASFLLCLTPFACELMGWAGSTTNGAVVAVGAFYYVGGLGLVLAGIMEWIVGNTFPSTVFITFGGYWAAFAFLFQPSQGIAAALGGSTMKDYNLGTAIYLIWWGVLVYLVASLRTNVIFVLLFTFLDINFWVLVAAYIRLGHGNTDNIATLLKVGGAFGFLTAAMGWYLLVVLVWGSTGVPIPLPVGDLSNFMSRRPKEA